MPRTVHTPPVARGQNPPGGLARVPCVPAVATTLALAVCGEATPPGSTADVVIDTIGDTVAVRTVSGSVWQGSATLVPETSIGELDGPDEYLFGNISSIAVDDEHTVYVFDGQAREVRVFDSGGTYIRTLGGPGEGPGEFSRVEAIAVLPDGRLVVRDAGTKHIKLFGPGPDDTDQWSYSVSNTMSYGSTPLYTDVHGRTFQADPQWNTADQIVVFGPDGTQVDKFPEPWGDYEEPSSFPIPFLPFGHWAVHPAGHLITGFPSDYRIDVIRDDGVLRIERAAEPARVSGDERTYYRDMITGQQQEMSPGWRWQGPAIPEHKPYFEDFIAGRQGRIWVRLATESRPVDNPRYDPDRPGSSPVVWRSHLRYDVFEGDGTYLGAIEPPSGFSAWPTPVFDGDRVWAAARDELGVGRVVRYRIEVGSAPGG